MFFNVFAYGIDRLRRCGKVVKFICGGVFISLDHRFKACGSYVDFSDTVFNAASEICIAYAGAAVQNKRNGTLFIDFFKYIKAQLG